MQPVGSVVDGEANPVPGSARPVAPYTGVGGGRWLRGHLSSAAQMLRCVS